MNADGTRYLIVKRSIGADTVCGGGESLGTDCVGKFTTFRRYLWAAEDEGDITDGLFRRIELGEFWDDGDVLYGYFSGGIITIYRDENLQDQVGQAIVSGTELTVFGAVEGVMILNEPFPQTDAFVFTMTANEIAGHPAIAWPTINGEEFFQKPTSGYTDFIRDDDLSNEIIEQLWNDEITTVNGDAKNHIPFVMFPVG